MLGRSATCRGSRRRCRRGVHSCPRRFSVAKAHPHLLNRYYDSRKASNSSSRLDGVILHEYDRSLRLILTVCVYVGPLARGVNFAAPPRDGASVSANGVTLRRLSRARYCITSSQGEPTFEFLFRDLDAPAPLAALTRSGQRISLEYDEKGCLAMIRRFHRRGDSRRLRSRWPNPAFDAPRVQACPGADPGRLHVRRIGQNDRRKLKRVQSRLCLHL
jgi:hypothetical protein